MDEAFTDWRFWLVVLGLTFSLGSLVWTVHRHAKILNGATLSGIKENLATLNEKAKTHAEDIRGLQKTIVSVDDKREASIARVHERLDNTRKSGLREK